MLAKTPRPPYYAVVFTSQLRTADPAYQAMGERMLALAQRQPGFLGVESARGETGITVSYWESSKPSVPGRRTSSTWKRNDWGANAGTRSTGCASRASSAITAARRRKTTMHDLCILLDDTPGSLARMGEVLGQAGISVEGGGAWVADGKGHAHFLFADGEHARRVL